jgi:hypothetical protein
MKPTVLLEPWPFVKSESVKGQGKKCTHGNTPWGGNKVDRQNEQKRNRKRRNWDTRKGHNMAPYMKEHFQQNPPLLETTKQYQNKVRMNLLGAVQ